MNAYEKKQAPLNLAKSANPKIDLSYSICSSLYAKFSKIANGRSLVLSLRRSMG